MFGSFTGAQILLSANDTISFILGSILLVLIPVFGYYLGMWVGRTYIAWDLNLHSTGDKK
jgi:hypothetical protein